MSFYLSPGLLMATDLTPQAWSCGSVASTT